MPKQVAYILTLQGLIGKEAADRLELYLRRHYSEGGHPAVIFDLDEKRFVFTTPEKENPKKRKRGQDAVNRERT